jgi:flagellar assembly factor FliW
VNRVTKIETSRFGAVAIEPDDAIRFAAGLLGLEGLLDWIFLADAEQEALGWMQSVHDGAVALPVVSPRRFVPDFQVRVPGRELEPLALDRPQSAQVLVIVSKHEGVLTLNLKAPLLVNLERRLGRQVLNGADLSVRHEVYCESTPWKKTA